MVLALLTIAVAGSPRLALLAGTSGLIVRLTCPRFATGITFAVLGTVAVLAVSGTESPQSPRRTIPTHGQPYRRIDRRARRREPRA